ncbi:MAG TPA: CPBP family intramembrane metalloprotease [Firmicutes bacterium]|jgi:membrane protease YdiL (CAAX protease family)|nr:CPBP family intramembrane metalloprotease [Bacillota bacterium]
MKKTSLPNLRRIVYPLFVIGVVYLLFLASQVLFLFLGNLLGHLLKWTWKFEELQPELLYPNFLVNLFFGLLPLLLAFFWAKKLIFRQRFLPRFFPSSRSALPDLCFGFGLGGILFGLLFLAFGALGWLRVTAEPALAATDLLWLTLTFFVSALFEELLFRGFHLPLLASHWGISPGIAFSAFLFSLAHLYNPHLNFFGLFGILIAGVLFAFAYIETGALYLPIALHFSWNFFQNLFGFRVSGLAFPTLFQVEVIGPPLWTGGAFGPEAGLSGLVLLSLATMATLLYGRYRRAPGPRPPASTQPSIKNRP